MPWQNNNGGGGDRNPWGQPRGGGPQPPNIDDLIRKGQDGLRNIIPGGGGTMKLLILAFVVIVLVFLSTYQVQPSQQGVVMRFGEAVYSTGPGLHLKLPAPIETVILADVGRQNRIDIGFRSEVQTGRNRRPVNLAAESLMLTGDENIVDIAFAVFWRIDNASDFLFNIQAPQEITIKAVAESAMREVIGRTNIQFALTEGRNQIQQDTQDLIQRTLNGYQAGVAITEVNLERVDPPQQVIDAFRDVQAAEADRERFRNEAEAYANSIIPEARGNANRVVQEAEAYKEQVIAQATGEAARFMSVYLEYAQAKDITRKRMYLETMEKIMAGMNKIILDDQAGSGVVPYLPLPEINRRRSQDQGGGNE